MGETANLSLPYIMPAQAQKHITHNEALQRLDALVQLSVIDRDLDSPPGSPDEGDRYLVAEDATGAWDGWDDSIAVFASGAWIRLVPNAGWICWVEDEAVLLYWDGAAWEELEGGGAGGLPLGGGTMTGPIAFTHQSSPSNPATGELKLFAKSDDKLYTRTSAGVEAAVGADALPSSGGTMTGPIAFTHQSSPSNPASGLLKLFAKSDNKLYTRTSAGVETEIGAGGGGGGGMTDAERRNAALVGMYQAKSFGAYRRGINTLWDGFAGSTGVNASRSSNHQFDTTNKCVKPVQSGNDSYTKVLLHFDGSDGSTTITDGNAGGSAHTFTAAGNAQIDTAIALFGGAALLCDGTGDWVSTPDHADFALGSGDFAIDLRFNWAGGSGVRGMMAGQADASLTNTSISFLIEHTSTNKIACEVLVGTTSYSVVSTTSYTTTGWHHLAFIRDGGTLRLFVDGAAEATTAISGSINNSSANLRVGAWGEYTSTPWNGSTDEFRLSVGIARWTSAFTPPAAAYGSGSADMTYSSKVETADAAATAITFVAEIDPIDAISLGTDLTAIATCNNWSNNGAATLTNVGKGRSGRTVIEGVATGLMSGTQFAAELVVSNNKNVAVHGIEVRAG